MRRVAIAVVLLLLGTQPVAPAQKNVVKMIYGAGAQSCGRWTSNAQLGANPRIAQVQWVLGYVSAAGMTMALRDTDAAAIEQWMNARCAKAPLDQVADAALLLLLELGGHAPSP